MTRNLKVLVLGLVAALALTAVAASSASAFTKFKATATTTTIKGPQAGTAKFTTNPGVIECSGGTFRGMVAAGTEPETVETSDSAETTGPEANGKGLSYTGCKFLGFIGVEVKNNTCQYRFHAATGKVDIVPNSGTCASTGITFSAIGCNVKVLPIAANQGLSGVTFSNSGSGAGASVNVQPNPVTGISYTASGCPSGNGSFANGVYGDGSVVGSSGVLVGGTTNTTSTMVPAGASIV
jgi:hypothetical protein